MTATTPDATPPAPPTPPTSGVSPSGPGSSAFGRGGNAAVELQRRFPLLQVLALAALYCYGLASIDGFGSKRVLYAVLVQGALLGLAAAGQTIVVLVGGIDFSIAGFITAGDVVIAQLCGTDHWSAAPAFAVALAIGLVGGALNGWISFRYKVEPLIVTLGMSAVVLGLLNRWLNGAADAVAPAWLGGLTAQNGKTFGLGIPPVVLIWAGVAIVIGVALTRTRAGRDLYLTGTNPRAARLALVRTGRVWIGAYVVSALLAVCVGVLLAGYSGAADLTIGDNYLFQSLAAVIVGGTMFGARGDYWRTVLGALILSVLVLILSAENLSSAVQQMITGGLILAVTAVYGRERRLRDRV